MFSSGGSISAHETAARSLLVASIQSTQKERGARHSPKAGERRWVRRASVVPQRLFCSRSVAQSCPTLCHPVGCSTPDLPVLHYLPEFAQSHVHWVGDAVQPSHPLSPPSTPVLNLPQRFIGSQRVRQDSAPEQQRMGTSLVVQWLRLCTFPVGGTGSITGWGTKIPHARWWGQKKKKKIKNKKPNGRKLWILQESSSCNTYLANEGPTRT